MTSSEPVTVLLVESDEPFANAARSLLGEFQGRTFNLVWKNTAETALQEVRENSLIDIILANVVLPGSSGLDFCLQLNQIGNTAPIILITEAKEFKVAIEAMKLGVEDFLTKDEVSEYILPRTIVTVLDRARRHAQMKIVQKRMLHAEKRAEAIRELVVTVCHEFNNPLAAIKISSDLLQRQELPENVRTKLREFEGQMQKIEKEIKRLKDINFDRIPLNPESLADGSNPASGGE